MSTHLSWTPRFLEEYRSYNVAFWGLTAENEPAEGLVPDYPLQALGFTPETQRDFVAEDLGPALHQAGLGHVKLMILDDQRLFLPSWAKTVSQQHVHCSASTTTRCPFETMIFLYTILQSHGTKEACYMRTRVQHAVDRAMVVQTRDV